MSTLIIEVPILSGWLWPHLGRWTLFWGILASSLTHPVLWFLWPQWGPRWAWIGSAELTIWLFEGMVYAFALRDPETGWAWRRGITLSGLANGASLGAGLLLLQDEADRRALMR